MRIAFISDIHGNLQSLELVLSDMEQENVEQTICLGDVASLGPQPREVIARLKELHIPNVMGNHDNYLLNPHLTKDHHPWLRELEFWCLSQLAKEDLDFLGTFQPHLQLKLDNQTDILCYHGSPRSNEEFLHPDTSTGTFDEVFKGKAAKFFIGGHTHVQMVSQHRGMTLLNPGSVGMPFEYPMRGESQHAFRRAEYMIVNWANGKLTFELRRLSIDFDQLAETARACGMPDVEFWLETWEG